jgi:hypothetical protein
MDVDCNHYPWDSEKNAGLLGVVFPAGIVQVERNGTSDSRVSRGANREKAMEIVSVIHSASPPSTCVSS